MSWVTVGIAMSLAPPVFDGLYQPFIVMNGGWFMALLYQHDLRMVQNLKIQAMKPWEKDGTCG